MKGSKDRRAQRAKQAANNYAYKNMPKIMKELTDLNKFASIQIKSNGEFHPKQFINDYIGQQIALAYGLGMLSVMTDKTPRSEEAEFNP